MKALIIDDAPPIRIQVRALLRNWGYEAEDAPDGQSGLTRITESDIRLVICDWNMEPGMSGPDVCQALRTTDLGRYVYVILLTGRSENEDLIFGLNSGADDFVSKPFDAQVLRARLRVAERILAMEDRLAEQNRSLREARNQLEQAYNQIQNDLVAAARIQRQMLPVSDLILAPVRAGWMFLPAAKVSGDNFNFYKLSGDLIGFYLLDVSGHGISAALLSASLSRSLVPGSGSGMMATANFADPAEFLADLNRQLANPDAEVENYATVVYGTLDIRTGEGLVALAGHPRPMLARADGSNDYLQSGGLPVGMFDFAAYTNQTFRLDPGDKLVLYSDGVTDCNSPDGQPFGDQQFQSLLAECPRCPARSVTDKLAQRLRTWHGPSDFDDDISVLVLELLHPTTGVPL